MISARALSGLLIVAMVSLSCGGGSDSTGPTAPDPGPLNLLLESPGGTAGAMLIQISGGPVTAVESPGYQLATSAAGATVSTLLRGHLDAGLLAAIQVPDRHQLSMYVVTVLQVADRNSYAQLAPDGYQVRLLRP